jgi:tetratricopeptide (TPR) repeat protein
MPSLNIRFVWNTPPVPGGSWHAGLVNLKRVPQGKTKGQLNLDSPDDPHWRDYRRHRLHLSLRGFFVWALAASFVTYLGGAALLQQRLQSANPRLQLHYLDFVLPDRWPNINRQRGAALFAEGRDLIAKQRFHEGFSLLRAGLSRNPSDPAARLDVATLYTALRLQPQAIKILREGLDLGYPNRAFLAFTLDLLEGSEAHETFLEICQLARSRLAQLPASARPAGDETWLDQRTVQALRTLGRSTEAIDFLRARFSPGDAFHREMMLLHHLESGRPAEAAVLARRWIAEDPANPAPLRLLIRADRESGDFAALDADLVRLRERSPNQLEPLLVALLENHRARRPEAAQTAFDTLILRHGADPALYDRLAPLLATLGLSAGLDRIEKELQERGLSLRPVLWSRLDLAKSRHDWPAVLACAESLATSPGPGFTDVQTTWLETADCLARACLDGASGTQTSLVEIVANRPGGLRLYTVLLDALLVAGRPATARHILTLAEGPYPVAPSLLAYRARIETALAASAPAPAATEATPPALASLAALEEALSSLGADDHPHSALLLLASARRVRPDWLPGAETRLDALELPLLARSDDPLRLQLLARTTLPRDTDAPQTLLRLARQIHSKGHLENARILLDEILRHDPAHPDALEQQKLWQPRPPP